MREILDGSRINGTGLREVIRKIDPATADSLDAGLEEALPNHTF